MTEPAQSQRDTLDALASVDVLDNLTDGIIALDRDWQILYANRATGEMAGRPHLELIGKRVWDEYPGASNEAFRATYEEAWRTGEPQSVVDRYDPLGTWFECRALPLGDELVVLIRDVTDQQQAEHDLREYVDGVAEAERIVRFGVWRWEVRTGRVRWSDELHRIYGLRPGEFEGTVEAFLQRILPEDRDRTWACVSRSLETRQPFAFEERILRADGVERTLLSQGRVITGEDGSVEALVGVCHDVTDRARVERALGASERRMHAIIDNTPSMITVKDLDGRYLMSNAEFTRVTGIEGTDIVGRLCADICPAEIAEAERADEQRAAIEGEPVYSEVVMAREGEPRNYVTVTFPLPDEQGKPAEMCTIATDVTERRERESERGERLEATDLILSALEQERMIAYAQPIIDLASGEQRSSELLIRMRTAEDRVKILGPESFLPAAERFELVQAIDTWMVRQALSLPKEIVLQVNLSAVTLGDPTARAQIVEMLRRDPDRAKRIVFEITETASMQRLDAAKAFAAEVTAIGARLALDDFGIGFGSFLYLRSLPFTSIKIDSSFVRGLVKSPDDRRVVKSVLSIAREFDLETVAEGVEDAATLELLRELGADCAQGYLLGRPAPLLADVRQR